MGVCFNVWVNSYIKLKLKHRLINILLKICKNIYEISDLFLYVSFSAFGDGGLVPVFLHFNINS